MDMIMVAVDGSGHAAKAIRIAAELAGACDAELLVFYADQPGPLEGDVADFARAEDLSRAEVAERIVNSAEKDARSAGAAKVRKLAEPGEAAEAILGTVEREKPDLLVLGSRGLSDFEGLVFGSVSHKVLHLADVPCLVAR